MSRTLARSRREKLIFDQPIRILRQILNIAQPDNSQLLVRIIPIRSRKTFRPAIIKEDRPREILRLPHDLLPHNPTITHPKLRETAATGRLHLTEDILLAKQSILRAARTNLPLDQSLIEGVQIIDGGIQTT